MMNLFEAFNVFGRKTKPKSDDGKKKEEPVTFGSNTVFETKSTASDVISSLPSVASIEPDDLKLFENSSNDVILVNNMLSSMLLIFYYRESKTSTIVSPFSLLSAFSMLLIGLTGKTLDEIQRELLIKNKKTFFDEFVETTKNIDRSVKINNFMLIKDEVDVDQKYKDDVKKLGSILSFKQSEIKQLVGRVNSLVVENTEGTVKDILKESDITKHTFLVLVNTLCLDLRWKTEFELSDTKRDTFYEHDGKTRTVQMMNLFGEELEICENSVYQALRLQYDNKELSMVIVVPRKKGIPLYFERAEFYECAKNFTKAHVNVKFPKFTCETEVDAIPFFKSHNMTQMFEYMHADNMIKPHDEQKVDAIRQKNLITVDEAGTHFVGASAITAECRECMTMKTKHKNVHNFYADHPFAYYIVHSSGLIVCSGTYF